MSNDEKSRNPGPCVHGLSDLQSRSYSSTASIVDTTPRVRPNHKWTTQMVAAYVNQMKQLRISGWLMYDFQHLDVVGRDRGTVWEVHPITKIEVQDQAGNWANLEQ